MLFERIKGHECTLSKLADMCIDGSFSGPYLFKGPEAVGKYTIARIIAKYLTCIGTELDPGCRCSNCRIFPRSPDFMDIDVGKNMIKIDDIAPIEEYASLSPFKSNKKVILINNAENLNRSASNKLLKLLEVNRNHIVYIFITSNSGQMLPTIVSRCRLLPFKGLDPEHISGILTKVNVSVKDILFLKKIHNYVHGGILSDYHKYLNLAKEVTSFVRSLSGRDEGDLLIRVDDIEEKGNLIYFIELLVIYVNDILKVHYDSSGEVSFNQNIDSLEVAAAKWEVGTCLAFIARLRKCLEVHNSGLNLKIKSNTKSAVSWAYMLLHRKKN